MRPTLFAHAPGAARAWVAGLTPYDRIRFGEQLPPMLDLRPIRGRAWFPVVVGDPDMAGTLLSVRVHTVPETKDAPLAQEAHDAVRTWMALVAGVPIEQVPLVRLVHDPLPLEHDVDGRSLEMAATVATVSHLLGRSPAIPIILSGTAADGMWGPIDLLDEKAEVCRVEAPGVRTVLLTKQVEPSDLLDVLFGAEWRRDLASALDRHPSSTAAEAWALFDARDSDAAARQALRAMRQGADGISAAQCQWILGTTALHQGRAAEAHRLLSDAVDRFGALDADDCDPHELAELEAYFAVSLVDTGHPIMAVERLTRVDSALEGDRLPRARNARVQVLGSLARAEVAIGRLADAARHLELSERDVPLPHERCRVQMDLAEVYRRMGDRPAQLAALGRAHQSLSRIWPRDHERTRRFLALYEVRAGLRAPLATARVARWTEWPQPAEVAEYLLATDPSALDAWVAGHLEGSGMIQAFVLLGYAARRLARDGGVLSDEIVAAARRVAADVDAPMADALLALAAGNPEPWVRQCPY